MGYVAGTLSCRSREDIALLAGATRNTVNPAGIAAILLASGMMKSQWWLHAGVRFMCWRHGISPQQAWGVVIAKFPESATEIIAGAADWIENGKDQDGEGVGGFNQREVDTLATAIDRSLRNAGFAPSAGSPTHD